MCVLPNHQFYFYILAVSSALLCVYILCNLYNLVSRHGVDSRCGYSRCVDIQCVSVLDRVATDGADVPGHQKIQRRDEHLHL